MPASVNSAELSMLTIFFFSSPGFHNLKISNVPWTYLISVPEQHVLQVCSGRVILKSFTTAFQTPFHSKEKREHYTSHIRLLQFSRPHRMVYLVKCFSLKSITTSRSFRHLSVSQTINIFHGFYSLMSDLIIICMLNILCKQNIIWTCYFLFIE